jgi:hypothetical protein
MALLRAASGCALRELWIALVGSMPLAPEVFWSRLLEVRDVLVFSFDFEVFERPLGLEAYATDSPWLPAFVVPDTTVSVLGRNGMGAVYTWCQRDQMQCCLHIDRRGTVVHLGRDLQQVVALVVALPYWPELLAECSAGELSSLRELARRLEQESCDDLYALPAARQELQSFLELPELADPVRHLYEVATAGPALTVWSPHGWRYESPFAGSARRVA